MLDEVCVVHFDCSVCGSTSHAKREAINCYFENPNGQTQQSNMIITYSKIDMILNLSLTIKRGFNLKLLLLDFA